jgi:succinate-semialdehyde dehydrogenase/glutarate-semialdehyde dehydrogenase
MGKPIKESISEVNKCIGLLDYYNQKSHEFLEDEKIPTKYKEALVVN